MKGIITPRVPHTSVYVFFFCLFGMFEHTTLPGIFANFFFQRQAYGTISRIVTCDSFSLWRFWRLLFTYSVWLQLWGEKSHRETTSMTDHTHSTKSSLQSVSRQPSFLHTTQALPPFPHWMTGEGTGEGTRFTSWIWVG